MPARHFEMEMASARPVAKVEKQTEETKSYTTKELFIKWIMTEEVDFHWGGFEEF